MALRFNNPGNIRSFYNPTTKKWATPFNGEILPPLQDTRNPFLGYRKFDTLANGFRALFLVLKKQYLDKGLNTIEKILPVYAPTSDNNNPNLYINLVEQRSGIKRNQILKTYSDLKPIVKEIARIETGAPIAESEINKGFQQIASTPGATEPTNKLAIVLKEHYKPLAAALIAGAIIYNYNE